MAHGRVTTRFASQRTLVALFYEGTFAHAVGEVRADFVGAVANRAGGYFEFARHVFVMLNLAVSLVQVIIQNQISLTRRQATETVTEANLVLVRLDSWVD